MMKAMDEFLPHYLEYDLNLPKSFDQKVPLFEGLMSSEFILDPIEYGQIKLNLNETNI